MTLDSWLVWILYRMQLYLKVNKRQRKWIMWRKMWRRQKIIKWQVFRPLRSSQSQSAVSRADTIVSGRVELTSKKQEEANLWKYLSQRGLRRYGVNHSSLTLSLSLSLFLALSLSLSQTQSHHDVSNKGVYIFIYKCCCHSSFSWTRVYWFDALTRILRPRRWSCDVFSSHKKLQRVIRCFLNW